MEKKRVTTKIWQESLYRLKILAAMKHKNWKSYFASKRAYEQDQSQFLDRPKLPKYKDKAKGRNILVYTIQALSNKGLKRGVIQPSGLPVEVQTQQSNIDQVRIVPRHGY